MRMRTPVRISACLAALFLAAACTPATTPAVIRPPTPLPQPIPIPQASADAPAVAREMRGLWVATVHNIDWPTKPGLTAARQKAELVDLLDRAKATGLNTIVFQVRPAADALYQSSIEPWASLLTGTQGVSPGYDPLAYAIAEAHARGMELHAWVNPFRAGNTVDSLKLARNHLFNTRRDLVHVYGTFLWMDPGEPEVHDRSIEAITDIVRRYDIDGIHADDYFYPYVETDASGKPIPFPDDSTYAHHAGGLSLADWRRENINRFIERLYREVHAIKPTVKVGISPFGIWRPGNPPSVEGLDAYESIYADSRQWLQQGWVDYLAPQLYWAISAPKQSFPDLLDWWLGQNTKGRSVWAGLPAYRVLTGRPSAVPLDEVPNQIRIIRSRPGGTGNIIFDATSTLKRNNGAIANVLASELYNNVALVPASPWLDSIPPAAPVISESGGRLTLSAGAGEAVRWWVIRERAAGKWTTRILFASETSAAIANDVDVVLVQAADQAGNLSSATEWGRRLTPQRKNYGDRSDVEVVRAGARKLDEIVADPLGNGLEIFLPFLRR